MNFQDEMGRVWAAPTLVQRNCIYCHKMFLIRADDDLTFDCGMQNAAHPPFQYRAESYRIGGEPEAQPS